MIRWWIRILFGLALGVATAVVVLADNDPNFLTIVHKGRRWFGFRTAAVVLSAGTLALGAIQQAVLGALERINADRNPNLARILHNILGGLWATLDAADLPRWMQHRMGLHIWLVPRWHYAWVPYRYRKRMPAWIRRRLPAPTLWRPAKLRLLDYREPTNIDWKRGKGVIGKCWEDREPRYFDARESWSTVTSIESWNKLVDDKLGLSFEEYQKLGRRYAQVYAVPIWRNIEDSHHTEFIGCVVVDTPASTDPTSGQTLQDQPSINTDATCNALLQISQRVSEQLATLR